MRREILRAGMAVALVGSATVACKKETNSPPNNSYSVAPGQCVPISEDLTVCNLKNKSLDNGYVRVFRISNGESQDLAVSELEADQIKRFDRALEGLEVSLDSNFILTVSVNEPLISATPVPTSTPLPTPFKIEPLLENNLTA